MAGTQSWKVFSPSFFYSTVVGFESMRLRFC